MSAAREALPVGWRPGPFGAAALLAAALLGAAAAIRFGGLGAGAAALVLSALAALVAWREAAIEGPCIHLRGARSAWRQVGCHARGIDSLEFRRGPLPAGLSLHRDAQGRTVLRATGPDPRHEAFRQAAMWLIVHGRRRTRIDPVLLDALAAMPDHARANQPRDASHA